MDRSDVVIRAFFFSPIPKKNRQKLKKLLRYSLVCDIIRLYTKGAYYANTKRYTRRC